MASDLDPKSEGSLTMEHAPKTIELDQVNNANATDPDAKPVSIDNYFMIILITEAERSKVPWYQNLGSCFWSVSSPVTLSRVFVYPTFFVYSYMSYVGFFLISFHNLLDKCKWYRCAHSTP